MPKPAVSTVPAGAAEAVAAPPAPLPFLLTHSQGEAARTLLSYVVSLPLTSADAQLLAVVVAIRAARTGAGNLTGTDLRSLRLDDPEGAVADLIAAGWEVPGPLIGGEPDKPVGILVPAMTPGPGHVLPLGKDARSRVSGWSMRTRLAKPVRKGSSAVRLAALFLAAHCSSELVGHAPAELPVACYGAVPTLLEKGFLAEVSGQTYRLGEVVGHLAGRFRTPEELAALAQKEAERRAAREAAEALQPEEATPERWAEWKSGTSPALLRHVEAVEQCALCRFPFDRVANAFLSAPSSVPAPRTVLDAYGTWRDAHPDCGREAALFTVAFRTEHGHGPSYSQLCKGLGWKKLSRALRGIVVGSLLAEGWLTDTSPVPWTLRPGKTAHAQGIVLPGQAARGRR
ncbi:hypothetical protein P8A18_18195 [Streptomyces castrisilvae]|uniref:Uncharacterized protein n=1 Tax=Streptomyces castrisilvae TaxID=3033811 RepID=A0ABY9HL51_9ACTN|nr:hypothetical protein [Streptomyces sp. Mut1]WLQ35230.1 hypothetical protein P8A18_18195 [Streptomyces sp. Mut1]